MKFGFRKPSFKRSLSAATKGALKRAIMREIVPYYGKRGMGWANPKKAVYNHLYSMVTANPTDIVSNNRKPKRVERFQSSLLSDNNYEKEVNSIAIYSRGLEQIKVPMTLFDYIKDDILNDSPMHKAIRQLNTIVTRYLNRSMNCGFDYCDMCEVRLYELKRINPEVKEICLNIVECIKCGASADDIFAALSSNKSLNLLVANSNNHVSEDTIICNNNFNNKQRTEIVCDNEKANTDISTNIKQLSNNDLTTWQIILQCIGVILVFMFLILIVIKFAFPAILLGLIFLSVLFITIVR